MSDASDCRAQARRESAQMYPVRPPPGQPRGATDYDADSRREKAQSVYDECMRRFGSDKPDLRYGLELFDASDLLQKTAFTVFSATLAAGGKPAGGAAGLRSFRWLQKTCSRKRLVRSPIR